MTRNCFLAAFALAAFLAAPPVAARPDTSLPVHSGSLTLKVPDFLAARQRLMSAATNAGAQITGGKTTVDEKGRKHGFVHLSVSADRLPELLPKLRAVGTLASDDLTTVNQSSEYENLAGRVRQLKKHEARLDELLHSRRNLRGSDILYVQERLFRTGVDAEQLMQAQTEIERHSRTARFFITLFEPLPVAVPVVAAQRGFTHTFTNACKRAEFRRDVLVTQIATAGAFALVYAPVWLPVFAAGFLLVRFVWLRRTHIVLAVGTAILLSRNAVSKLTLPPQASEALAGEKGN